MHVLQIMEGSIIANGTASDGVATVCLFVGAGYMFVGTDVVGGGSHRIAARTEVDTLVF